MEQTLHLDLHRQNELSTVEKLTQGCFGVELARNADVYLFRNFLKLVNLFVVLHESVCGRTAEHVSVVCRRDSH